MLDFLALKKCSNKLLLPVLVLLLLLAGAWGCINVTNPAKTSSPYLPLAVGNWWTYHDSMGSWTVRVTGTQRVDTEDVYVVEGAYRNLPQKTYFYFDSACLRAYLQLSADIPTHLVFFQELVKVPFAAGQSYTNLVGTWTVESLTAEVSVAGRTFTNCLRLKIEPNIHAYTDTHIFHLAPNVGLVRSENPYIHHVIELEASSLL